MLTSEQIESYFESGYLLVEDVVTLEQLQRMQDFKMNSLIVHDM